MVQRKIVSPAERSPAPGEVDLRQAVGSKSSLEGKDRAITLHLAALVNARRRQADHVIVHSYAGAVHHGGAEGGREVNLGQLVLGRNWITVGGIGRAEES